MDALSRFTGWALEPLFACLTAFTPAKQIAITDETSIIGAVVMHVPVHVLAFLLFSSANTRRLRAALLPLALAATFYLGFTFRFADRLQSEKNKGQAMQAVYWLMKVVEMGLRRERPIWVGWEEDQGAVREKRRAKANRVDTWGRRAYLAVTYNYAFRSLGWSTGPSKRKFNNLPDVPPSLGRAALPHVIRTVEAYLAWDLISGLFSLHPSFSDMNLARSASIYEPIPVPLLSVTIPSWLSAVICAVCWGTIIYLSQAFAAGLFSTLAVLLSPDWRTTALHLPALFNAWWMSESLAELWSIRWHSMYRAAMLFCGYFPTRKLGGQLLGVLATFLLSGVFHSAGYFTPHDARDKELAIQMLNFFVLCGAAIIAEQAFSRLTGRCVHGLFGRIWVWSILLYAGIPLSQAWLRCGGAVGMGAGEKGLTQLPFGRPMVWLGRRILRYLRS